MQKFNPKITSKKGAIGFMSGIVAAVITGKLVTLTIPIMGTITVDGGEQIINIGDVMYLSVSIYTGTIYGLVTSGILTVMNIAKFYIKKYFPIKK